MAPEGPSPGKVGSLHHFSIHKIRYLKDVETLIHNLFDTPGNSVKGKVPRDADLNRILREVLVEHEHAIRGIKRALR